MRLNEAAIGETRIQSASFLLAEPRARATNRLAHYHRPNKLVLTHQLARTIDFP
jgi:hypothetical protein